MICIGGDLHRRPPMHALHALSQGAPAGRRVRRRDVLQKDDASRRRKETRPHEGKKQLTMLGEKDGEDALRRPQSTAEGGASGGAGP